MRRIPSPGAGLAVLVAAAALPIVIKASKPLAKKIGEGIEKFGRKLKEATVEEETKAEPKIPDPPKESAAATKEPKVPDAPTEPKATKVRQTKPRPKTTRAKKTVKSTPTSRKPKSPPTE
ncbi:MAG: hypothetical protein KF836_02395 [Fimbriimonadaceae bacterium]|nr:hypothetical protein [Fimbriimonadaceae bacterium]